MDIAFALLNLYPNSEWHLKDAADFNTLVWMDKNVPAPTLEEVQAYIESQTYSLKRRAEYPAIGDQLDAMWKGGEAAADMLARVQAIKNKYPKPQ